MAKKRCLYCYQLLEITTDDFHSSCSKKIFEQTTAPILPYTENQMLQLANQVIKSHVAVTGVQAKLSVDVAKQKTSEPKRFTIVGLWGSYILKPPTEIYPNLPEVEDVTMHLAELSNIKTVPHSLIRLQSGKLAYITKRIDRNKGEKFHMEDMCQLTERLTENKYDGSYEQIAKIILKFSAHPMLDVVNFYEQVLFSFLTGNADMHLKNFSLIHQSQFGYTLSPAYDMVASGLINKSDKEELALTLNGKKKKIKRMDFIEAFKRAELNEKVIQNLFKKFDNSISVWKKFIAISFLSKELKKEFSELIDIRYQQIKSV